MKRGAEGRDNVVVPCPPHPKSIGSTTVSLAVAQQRLAAAQAVHYRSRGGCHVYWSHGDQAWLRLWSVGPGRVRLELVNSSDCPC